MGPSPDPLGWLGAVVDSKYRVDAFVGAGGFGYVYRGTHLRLAKPIAIKFLRPELAIGHERQRKFLMRFLAEGRILHDLSRATAGVVQALDLGAATSPSGSWAPFLVMEWIDGPTLADALRSRPTRTIEEAIALLDPLLVALETAHELGVAHLDLKPSNVMLARIGSRDTMKVLDFGIAKAMDAAEDEVVPGKTGIGTRMFTPAYGAPEQFDPSLGPTGPWTDVYALGLMLLEIVDGQSPYASDDARVCKNRALDLESRPAFRHDRSLDAVMRRVLAVDPRNRPRNAAELRRALREPSPTVALTVGPRTEPGPAPAPARARARPPTPRWPWLAGVLATTVGGFVGVAAYFSVGDEEPVAPDAGSAASSVAAAPTTPPMPPSHMRARQLFARWEKAERERNPKDIVAEYADPACFYGSSKNKLTIEADLRKLYSKEAPHYAQSADLDSVEVVSLDGFGAVRIEFVKKYAMDGRHYVSTRGYLIVNADGKVSNESDQLSESNLRSQDVGASCRAGLP